MSFNSAKVVDTVAVVVAGSLETGAAVISTTGDSVEAAEVSGAAVDCSSATFVLDGANVTGDAEVLTTELVIASAV